MDWSFCIICQKPTGENLQCPANSKRKGPAIGYTSFVNNLKEFQNLDILPVSLKIDSLDEGPGIEQTLASRNASWHKSCRDLFSNTKLEHAKKRKLAETQAHKSTGTGSPIKARRSSTRVHSATDVVINNQCFFCDKADNLSSFRSASTLEFDQKARVCSALKKWESDSQVICWRHGCNRGEVSCKASCRSVQLTKNIAVTFY